MEGQPDQSESSLSQNERDQLDARVEKGAKELVVRGRRFLIVIALFVLATAPFTAGYSLLGLVLLPAMHLWQELLVSANLREHEALKAKMGGEYYRRLRAQLLSFERIVCEPTFFWGTPEAALFKISWFRSVECEYKIEAGTILPMGIADPQALPKPLRRLIRAQSEKAGDDNKTSTS